MSLQVEKLEGNMAKLTIEASAEEFEAALNTAYNKNKNKISIPGFRKGKATRKVIEKMYGAEVFYDDAANELMPEAYAKAVDECEEEIVSSPKVDIVQAEAGKPFIFTAEVALKPGVTLGQYKGIEVEKFNVEVTDEDVQAELDRERENNARTITVDNRAVENGDITVLDFEGFVDGVAFEGGKGENYSLTIGSGAFIPGFEEQLIGAEIDKEVDVNVTFPEDYQAEELAGKAATFKCTVHEIKAKELPELDDEFASEVSEFDTLEEYKADVRKNLEEKKVAEAKDAKEETVVDLVVEKAEMDIPEAMLATEQRRMADEFAQRLQMQGLSVQQYFQFTGLTTEAFFEQMKPNAEKNIRTRLTLEAVADAENMVISDEEFDAEIAKMAETYKMELDNLKSMIGAYEEKSIKSDLKIRKAVDFVVAEAVEV